MPDQRPLPRLRRAAPRRTAVLVVVGALVLGLLGSPATGQAQPDQDPPKTEAQLQDAKEALIETLALAPDNTPPSPDDPFADVVEADKAVVDSAMVRLDLTARSNAANLIAFAAAQELRRAKVKEAAAIAVRQAAIAELSRERHRLSQLTVRAYVTGGDVDLDQYRAIVEGDTTDPAAGRQILFSQVLDRQKHVTESAQRSLKTARSKLRDVRRVVLAATDKATRLLGIASNLTTQRATAEQDHVHALGEAAAARQRLQSAGRRAITPAPLETPLIGLPRLTAEDLAGWFAQGPYHPGVSTPMEDYARWFIEEGNAEGIRGDVAFAQAVLETGGFTNTDSVVGNNFSGIGHYDNVPLGFAFASPRLGVRAQIQLLKAYAVRKPHYANPLVDKRLRGPAGCCQTWGDLTTVWATDPTYGPKVMLLYTSLVDYALKRRARGEGMETTAVLPPA